MQISRNTWIKNRRKNSTSFIYMGKIFGFFSFGDLYIFSPLSIHILCYKRSETLCSKLLRYEIKNIWWDVYWTSHPTVMLLPILRSQTAVLLLRKKLCASVFVIKLKLTTNRFCNASSSRTNAAKYIRTVFYIELDNDIKNMSKSKKIFNLFGLIKTLLIVWLENVKLSGENLQPRDLNLLIFPFLNKKRHKSEKQSGHNTLLVLAYIQKCLMGFVILLRRMSMKWKIWTIVFLHDLLFINYDLQCPRLFFIINLVKN